MSYAAWLVPAVVVGFLGWRLANRDLKPLLGVYLAFYFLTTYVGGVAIGLTDGEILYEWGAEIDVANLSHLDVPAYWTLLLLPLIVPFLAEGAHRLYRSWRPNLDFKTLNEPVSSPVLALAFGLIALAVLAALAIWGSLPDLLLGGMSDPVSLLEGRIQQFANVPGPFYGLLYITLPTLAFALLYNAAHARRLREWILFGLAAGFLLLLDAATLQKSIFILFLIFCILALVELKITNAQSAAAMFALPFGALYFMQSVSFQSWNFYKTVQLIFLRMASSLPFYFCLYPAPAGEDVALTRYVYESMYHEKFTLTGVPGDCPASAHVTAYYHSGLFGATMCLVGIALLLAAFAYFRRYRGPLGFGLYMGTLVAAYYWTQTSFREPLYSPYGIVCVLPAIALSLALSHLRWPRR